MENAESNGIPFRAYWWLALTYLAFFVGLFSFYDHSYRTALVFAVILGYSLHAFFYWKRLRISQLPPLIEVAACKSELHR